MSPPVWRPGRGIGVAILLCLVFWTWVIWACCRIAS